MADAEFKGLYKTSSACICGYIHTCTDTYVMCKGEGKEYGKRCLSSAELQAEAKNGLKVLAIFVFLLGVKPTFKYLNDNAGVTLNPFSRFIKSTRKSDESHSEKSNPVSRGGGRERLEESALKF